MNETYRNAVVQMEEQGVQDEYILGWQGGFLGHPPREETRTTDAYDAGYEDGQEKNLANIGNWKKIIYLFTKEASGLLRDNNILGTS